MTAAELIACPDCGKDNDNTHTFCCQCGRQLRDSHTPTTVEKSLVGGFRWGWAALSMVLIAGTVTISSVLLDLVYRGMGGGEFADLLANLTFGIGMVLGGMVAGYASPGVTIKEPAVAAALVTILYAVSGHIYAGVTWVWVVAFLLAWMGAWLGEKLQGTI